MITMEGENIEGFKITEFINAGKSPLCDDEIIVGKKYEVRNWDDLNTLIDTLIDFGCGSIEFKVEKITEANK